MSDGRMKNVRRWLPGVALTGVLVLGACQGDNLFKPLQGPPPEIVGLAAPAEVKAGGKLDVAVRAIGDLPIDSIVVRVRGAFGADSKAEFAAVTYDAQAVLTFDVPVDIADSIAFIAAIAYDAAGQISNLAEDQVRIGDVTPPTVDITGIEASDDVLGAGTELEVSLSATDNVGLNRVGYLLVHENGDTLTTELVQVTGSRVDTAFVYTFGEDVPEGNVDVVGLAEDVAGNVAATPGQEALAVTDIIPPEISFLYPAPGTSYPAGSAIDSVVVRVTDNLGVSTVLIAGVSQRGSVDLGTGETVVRYEETAIDLTLAGSPADTTVRRGLTPVVDNTAEGAFIIVQAVDSRGNLAVGSLPIELTDGTPIVEILEPVDFLGYPVGDSLLVTARVADNSGIASVQFSGEARRGNPDLGTGSIVSRFEPKTVTLDPAASDTILTRWMLPTPDSASEDISLVVAALDDQGNPGADTITIRLGTPKIEILAPSDGATVQAGRSLGIRFRVSDPRGLLRVQLNVSGVVGDTIVYSPDGATDIQVDTSVVLPSDSVGVLDISVEAINNLGIAGTPAAIQLVVNEEGADDLIGPTVGMVINNPGRLELSDSIKVEVTGEDDPEGTGVVTVGYSVRGFSPSRTDTLVTSDSVTFSPARTATVVRTFGFTPFNVARAQLPDTLVYEITSYMVDEAGNCSATTSAGGEEEELFCGTRTGVNEAGDTIQYVVAEEDLGIREPALVVSGRTVQLPRGGTIMDAAVDTAGRKLFLSNIDLNRVEVFRLDTDDFGDAIGVGSQPWGLMLNRAGDTLVVANSGGTNLSLVDVVAEQEVNADRFLTPDVVLYTVALEESDSGTNFLITEIPTEDLRFSDRPQFVAVDSFGNLVYTTTPSESGPLGTVRKSYQEATSGEPETILGVTHTVFEEVEDSWAVAHIDSLGIAISEIVDIQVDTATGVADTTITYEATLTMYDHIPGFADSVIVGTGNSQDIDALIAAAGDLRSKGSDVWVVAGTAWNASFAFGDTTFVAASGDRGWVLVGEGAVEAPARVLMYEAAFRDTMRLSGNRAVWDDLTNRSDAVNGVGVNYDGSLGVARAARVGFFSEDLRLEGTLDVTEGAAGAALHPLHANQKTLQNLSGTYRPDTHFSFVGAGNNSIDVIDTWRFTRIGRVEIRDVVTGPIRATLPFPGDNDGLTCSTIPVTDRSGNYIGDAVQLYMGESFTSPLPDGPTTDDQCIVVKLYGITDSGGVVEVDVRKADILRFHPNR